MGDAGRALRLAKKISDPCHLLPLPVDVSIESTSINRNRKGIFMTQQRRSTRQRGHKRLAPAAFAVRLALMTLAGAGLAVGPQPALAQSATVEHRIPAGPLSAALHAYAAKAGITLSFEESLTAGLRTQGLQGSYGVQQGLDRLLEGTGLDALPGNGGGWRLRRLPQPAQGEAVLGAVKVTAAAERSGTTEGSGSYTARVTTTATKLALSPRETPQTVTVVTRQKMDDFGLTNVDDVLESTSAISIQRRGNNGVAYASRGFALQSQYDGMPNPIGIGENNRGAPPDTAFLDKVEILQGASGLMSGAGNPGGTINMVRKRPTERFQAHVEAQLGSWNKKRLVGDVSGPLIDSGRIRGRAVALVDREDSFTDHVFDNRQGFYGIVEADVTATTTVGASVMYQKNEFNDHYGVPMGANGADLGLPRSSFYGVKNGDSTRESTSYTLNLEQNLPADWLLKAVYTNSNTKVDKVASFLVGIPDASTGDGLSLWRALHQREFRSDVFDIYASGPFHLLGRKHELVVGASSARMEGKNRLTPFVWSDINIYRFDADSIARPGGSFPAWPTADETIQRGVYAATRLSLADPLKLILGTRASWYEYKATWSRQKEDGVVTPYAGLIYDIDKTTSVYASYSDIFQPQSSLKFGGGTIDPIVGKNYELGAKSEFMQGRLNASAAVFRLEQTNLAQADQSAPATACNGGQCYTAAGLVVSQGVDLGINGEPLPGWRLGAGYSYVEREYRNGSNKGQAYGTYMPEHIFRVYTTYLIPGTDWTVGGNVRTQSRMYTKGTGLLIEQGGHTVVGLMAKYRINERAEVGMTVNNLFDRRYYESIGSYGPLYENFYGAPRSFAVNLKYAF